MEGPTPVSALIHAATMVTAGVYMVCLLSPMFEYAPSAKAFVTIIGATTALFAATVGLAQNDIKRVIAYSTCSQLGYMFLAAGVGAYQGAMFHLFTHAFFKGLLFLAAGSVITGMHHEQDMRAMGGLWRRMPITYAVMLIGTLAITGVGIPGLELGFAGFYSKDADIDASYLAELHGSGPGMYAFIIGVLAAGLTSFYSWRLIFMTFHGTPKWAHADGPAHEHAAHGSDHASSAQIETHDEPLEHGHDANGPVEPHESPWVMLVPLLVLAAGAVIAGKLFDDWFVGPDRDRFWGGAIFNLGRVDLAEPKDLPAWVVWAPLVASAIGFVTAWWMYIRKEGMGARIAARRGPIWSFLYNKWWFDELYDATFVRAARWLGDLFWKGGDEKIIDGLGPDGVSALSYATGRRTGRLQTGYVYHYAFVMLVGVVALVSYALWAFSQGGR
jgi:NADH-quinone oxidoreductase subunit L